MRTNERGASWLYPIRGDVIIQQLSGPPAQAKYQLSRLGRRGRLLFRTYLEALSHADRQAVMTETDVWYTSDHEIFHRVAEHRRPNMDGATPR